MEQEQLSGMVESVVFASDDGRFSVFRLKPEGKRHLVTATIPAAPPLVGQQVQLTGAWFRHPRFGEQFKATGIQVAAPSSAEGIERFLASGAVEGVGPAMASRLVAAFGEKALDVIENEPHRLREIPGIGPKTAAKMHASYTAQSEIRDIMLWLETHGVSGAYAGRLYKQYGSFALDVLERDPYRLAREVGGFGFVLADRVAQAAGVVPEDPQRLAAGLGYALRSVCASGGHCCLPEDLLIGRAAQLLGVSRAAAAGALREELRGGQFLTASLGSELFIYPTHLYRAETEVAGRLLDLKRRAVALTPADAEALTLEWEQADGIELAMGQRAAIAAALSHGIFLLTGGPGTGKTTVIRGMLAIFERLGYSVLLGAPTGRAAKRLAESTGRKAMTVHRLLESQGRLSDEDEDEAVFGRDEDEPLTADVVILDEISMMDIVLMRHFLAAAPPGCHVILVGDADQLPSVGPGAVLKELLRSEVFPCVRLTEIFRQAEESVIVRNAHAINAGRLPVCALGTAFEFREAASEEDAARQIAALCGEELPAAGYDVQADVQVLSPMHRQPCGVDALNRLLQKTLNPAAPGRPEIVAGAVTYRLGDKVIQMKNDYQKGVFNGDLGVIEAITDRVMVRYGPDLVAEYETAELVEIAPAYAISVHKSQGSEYPVILLPLVPGHRVMLQRNLLYTAVTRAKERVILVGSRAALLTAVGNDRTRRRYTLLAERLNETPLE